MVGREQDGVWVTLKEEVHAAPAEVASCIATAAADVTLLDIKLGIAVSASLNRAIIEVLRHIGIVIHAYILIGFFLRQLVKVRVYLLELL